MVELGLLFDDRAGGGDGGAGGDSGGGDAEGLLEGVNELAELQNGQALDLFDHGGDFFAHFNFPPNYCFLLRSFRSGFGSGGLEGAALLLQDLAEADGQAGDGCDHGAEPPFCSRIWPRQTARPVMGAIMVPRTFAYRASLEGSCAISAISDSLRI